MQAIRELIEANKWRPIEEAPRDYRLAAVCEVLLDAVRSIAYRPIGGDTSTYFCAVNIQNDAKDAIAKAGTIKGSIAWRI